MSEREGNIKVNIAEENHISYDDIDPMEEQERYFQEKVLIYYKFRFTFSDQDAEHNYDDEYIKRCKKITKSAIEKLLSLYDIKYLTAGIEQTNKAGDKTWLHTHIHFSSTAARDTIAKMLKRHLGERGDNGWGQETSGVKVFSLKPEPILRNREDFYRYPLKENLDKSLCFGFQAKSLENMHKIASECKSKSQEVWRKRLDHTDQNNSIFEKLKDKFEKVGVKYNGDMSVNKLPFLTEATQLYIDEERPVNKQTIMGYVDNYILSKGYMTIEQYWNM